MPRISRAPSHAGSWYEREGTQSLGTASHALYRPVRHIQAESCSGAAAGKKLEQQIEGWLAKADDADKGPAARAIIAP